MSLCSHQLVERYVLGGRFGTTVIGQDPAAEATQSIQNGCADASRSDDPNGHVAEFPPAHVVQSVVMSLRTAEVDLARRTAISISINV